MKQLSSDELLALLEHYKRGGKLGYSNFQISMKSAEHDVQGPISLINLYHPRIKFDADSFTLNDEVFTGVAMIGQTEVQVRISV